MSSDNGLQGRNASKRESGLKSMNAIFINWIGGEAVKEMLKVTKWPPTELQHNANYLSCDKFIMTIIFFIKLFN